MAKKKEVKKQTIKSIKINDEVIELPFPVEIVPYSDNSGTIGSIQHTYTIQMGQIVIELIKGFMERIEKQNTQEDEE